MKGFTLTELLDLLPSAYQPEGNEPINAVIQINAKGEGGGDWYVVIDGDECKVISGISTNSDLKLGAKTSDLLDIVSGKLDGLKAYMTGKIHFSGSITLAMKIARLFVIPADINSKFLDDSEN